ncbi:MAG TPA: V-type ATPase 116kDa subunit family protein, partial [bacterium]|nr:V-type ATPase 116kDa subunit family protein [bacterium]
LVRQLGCEALPSEEKRALTAGEVEEQLSTMEKSFQPIQNRERELTEEIRTREAMLAQVIRSLPVPLPPEKRYSFLEVHLGTMPEKNLPVLERSLSGIPHVFFPVSQERQRGIYLLVGLKRDRALLEAIRKDVGWEKVEFPPEQEGLSRAVEEKLRQELSRLSQQLAALKEQKEQLRERLKEKLSRIAFSIALKKGLLTAHRYMLTTERTGLLAGWVPADRVEQVIQEVRSLSPVCHWERTTAEATGLPREQIPVLLKQPALLKPFQLLVKSYGLPCYGTVDPTLFVAISFLLMFGAMFGDIGHGLALALTGMFLHRSQRIALRQAGALLLYCGASATVFGFLYGSLFGFEYLPAVWNRPMENITGLFQVSLAFGVGLITLGVLLNVVNAVRDHDYLRAIFDKAGLISGLVYWIGIALILKWVSGKIPVSPVEVFLLASGFLLLFVGPFLQVWRHPGQHSLFETFMESLIGLVEVVMGYLANTVSFIRVAAFALAHAGLFLAIFQLTRLTGGHGVVAGIILVAGNILIVLLEGLVVTIQSLRLNYYEFFSRFFVPGTQEYRPLTLP